MPVKKTVGSDSLARFLRRHQAELGKTHAEIAADITANGYEVSAETVARWARTGAIPIGALASGIDAIAHGYGVTPKQIQSAVGVYTFWTGESDDPPDLPEDLLEMLERATPEQMALIKRLVKSVVDPGD